MYFFYVMFGWCNDQLCVLLSPSRIYGHYFVSFKPYDNPQCLCAEPVHQFTPVYVIDRNRMCYLDHGNMCSYMVCVRDGFNLDFVPCWRVRRTNKPFSLINYHRKRLKNVYSSPKSDCNQMKPRLLLFASPMTKSA